MKIKTNEDKLKVIELYNNGYTLCDIAKEFNLKSYSSIRLILLKNGINLKTRIGCNTRSKKINEKYFNIIDTPEKAYILGWIISDGYVNKYKLSFCIKDLEILLKIKKELNSEHKITQSCYYDKRTEKEYDSYYLQIISKKIVLSLNKLGIYQRKSFNSDLPNIESKLYPDLIRGIFDGDGYIGVEKRNNKKILRFSIIVSELLYNKLEPIFNENNMFFKKPELISNNIEGKILKILIYKKNELYNFYKYIYYDGCMKLDRKYEKFKEVFIDE